MKNHRRSCRNYARALSIAAAGALSGVNGTASAGFFQLQENNVSDLGNAYAGGTAIAEDASTVWYRPAGTTRLSGSQLVVAGHLIQPSTKFSKTIANLSPAFTGVCGKCEISGGEGGDVGETMSLQGNWKF